MPFRLAPFPPLERSVQEGSVDVHLNNLPILLGTDCKHHPDALKPVYGGVRPVAVPAVNLVPSLGDDSGPIFVVGLKFKDPLRVDYVLPFGDI